MSAASSHESKGQTGSFVATGRTPSDRLAQWASALHRQESEDAVLAWLMAGSLAGTTGREQRAFLLEPDWTSHELVGRLGLSRDDLESCGLLPAGTEGDADSFSICKFEELSPGLTGSVRSVRFALERDSDPSVASFSDGRCRHVSAQEADASKEWQSRFQLEGWTVYPVSAGEEALAVLVVSEDGAATGQTQQSRGWISFLCQQASLSMTRIRARRQERFYRSQLADVRELTKSLLNAQGLSPALAKHLKAACQACEAVGGSLWLLDRSTQAVYLAKSYQNGTPVDEQELDRGFRRLAEDVTWRRESPVLESAAKDARIGAEARDLGSVIAVPLLAVDQPRGAMILHGKNPTHESGPHVFDVRDRELLEHYAALTGILSEVAELESRASEAERLLTDARQARTRIQAMADLGETSMRLARETAGSLASVTGFARRVQGRLEDEDPNREYLEIVVREGERIEKLVREHLQFASLQRPRLGMSSLNHLLQSALEKVTPTIEKRRVRLLKKLDSNVPGLLLDEDKIEQAFINVVNSALEGVSTGGRLLVQSRCTKEHAVVEVCHDGPPLSNDVLEQLFVPFGTGGRPGVGMGLALALQIIRDHGGEVAVKARGDWGHITALSLPILENSDRRARIDRRHGRGRDRRNRFPLK